MFSCYVHQDELEAHSKPDSITVFIHYGGDRTSDPRVIAEADVVLTTYGVLTAAYKSVSNAYISFEFHLIVSVIVGSVLSSALFLNNVFYFMTQENTNSIYHRVEWHRVVLDEAHTIKSSKTIAAKAAFALTSYCRWCLTGTPLQVSLHSYLHNYIFLSPVNRAILN